MENNVDIENLFKNTLENAEAQPPAGAWEAIQAKMGVTAASTSAGAAATGLGIGKIAAIVVTALGVGLGAGYLAFKGNNSSEKNNTPAQENTVNGTEENILSENTPVTLPEDVKITDVTSVNKSDKTVSIVEVKKGQETKKILVEIPNYSGNNNGSVVNQWLSPNKNDKLSKQVILQRIMEELEKEDNNETVNENQPEKTNEPVRLLEEDEVIAGIKASPSADLTIDFSNLTNAAAYEWNFGDNTTSKESNPSHTYNEPGSYVVALTVYNKAGKAFTHKDLIEVKAKEEITPTVAETSSINKPNIFTPNGDGKSDEFYFTGKNIESFTVTIYDQNNRVVYSSNDINQHWNGTDKGGNPLNSGKYLCTFKAMGKDKKVYEDSYFIMLSTR